MAANPVVEVSTIVFLLLSSILSLYLTRNYLARRQKNYLYWSIGMWFFALSDLFEVLFAFGAYSAAMARAYLFLVAFLVIPLAVGSLYLVKSKYARVAYAAYSVITVGLLAYYTATSSVGQIVTDSVVNGNLPMNVILWSTFITVPALIIIVVVAVLSYLRTKRKKVLWIIAGMVVFALGGTLYIASFPASTYYTEFLGLVMLWLGFFDFGILKGKRKGRRR